MDRRRGLLDFSKETIGRILLDVDAPHDLLHLSLTCKAMQVRIVPFHIEFRHLKIGLDGNIAHVLDLLLDQPPTVLARYRTVELRDRISKEEERIPWCLLDSQTSRSESTDSQPQRLRGGGVYAKTNSKILTFKEAQDAMNLALQVIAKMSNLNDITFGFSTIHLQCILRILSAITPNLANLTLRFLDFNTDLESIYGSAPWLPLSSLTQLRLSDLSDQTSEEVIRELAALTPSLSALEIRAYDAESFLHLCKWGRWPRLNSVYFSLNSINFDPYSAGSGNLYQYPARYDDDAEDPQEMITFFKSHPTLTILAIEADCDLFLPLGKLTDEILPNLRGLATNLPVDGVLTPRLASQLTHVCCVFGKNSCGHLKAMRALTECLAHLPQWSPEDFLEAAPKSVHKLVLDVRQEYLKYFGDQVIGYDILCQFPSVTHLAGITNSTDVKEVIFSDFVEQLPALTHVSGVLEKHMRLDRRRNPFPQPDSVWLFFRNAGQLDKMIDWVQLADLNLEGNDEEEDEE